MTRSTRAAQVPGAPAPATDPTAAQSDTVAGRADDDTLQGGDGETPEQELARLRAENAEFRQQKQAASEARVDAADAAAIRREVREPGKLRAIDVDPTKIKRAVLTADGWVCPATAPAAPKG